MEYIAISRNVKMSPRKVRLVVDGVKRFTLSTGLAHLSALNQRAARPIKKTIESAISNAVNNFNASRENLSIKDILVTEGSSLKRYHFAGRGRTRPYKKRTSHIRVILEDKLEQTQQKPIETAEKEEPQK